MPREQEVNGKFRVKLRKVSSPLPPPATGSSDTFIYPEALSQCRYGVIDVNPNDDLDILVAATGPASVLHRLSQVEGVQALSENDAQALLQQWRQR